LLTAVVVVVVAMGPAEENATAPFDILPAIWGVTNADDEFIDAKIVDRMRATEILKFFMVTI